MHIARLFFSKKLCKSDNFDLKNDYLCVSNVSITYLIRI